jgi:hypothetical protein
MFNLAVLALGGEVDWEDHDPESSEEPLGSVMERATAADRIRTEPLINGRALIPDADDAEKTITDLAATGILDVRDLRSPLRAADAAAIAQGFRDAHTIADMALLAEAVGASHGPDAGGFGGARLFAPDHLDALTVAMLVRATLLIRRAVPDAAFEATAIALNQARGPLTVFLELRRSLPAHSDVLGLDYAERLAKVPEPRAAEIQREVAAFLESRPDLLRLLAAPRDGAPSRDLDLAR